MAERELIKIYRGITKVKPSLSNIIADQIDLVAMVAGVESKRYTDSLRR
jgi:hypothetical protein